MKKRLEFDGYYTRDEQIKMWTRDMSRLHQDYVQNPCDGAAQSFLDAYGKLTQQTMETNDPGLTTLFTQYFTPIVKLGITVKRDMNIATYNMMCRVLCKKKVVDELLAQRDVEGTLGWFCSYMSVVVVRDRYALEKNKVKRQNQFAALLEHWTGKPVPVNKPPTLETVIVHLYGEVCWDLLGSDIHANSTTEELRAVIDSVHALGLPYIFKKPHTPEVTPPGSLPENIAL